MASSSDVLTSVEWLRKYPVVVTGASGYIAGHIISVLISRGYKVRGVIRDLKNASKTSHLQAFVDAGQLELFECPDTNGYVDAFKNTSALIHTATPYFYTAEDPQRDIVDPAIKAAVDALDASGKNSETLKRVIFTSSGGAVINIPPPGPNYVYTDKDYNTTSTLATNAYFYSKVLAEKSIVEKWNTEGLTPKLDLIVVNPFYVLGPVQNSILNTSIEMFKKQLLGQVTQLHPGGVAIVDVRDVAEAHVLALEKGHAGQRLLVSGEVVTWRKLSKKVKTLYPNYPGVPLPDYNPEEETTPPPFSVDSSPIKALGLHPRSLEETLKDTVQSLVDFGVVEKK